MVILVDRVYIFGTVIVRQQLLFVVEGATGCHLKIRNLLLVDIIVTSVHSPQGK